MFNVAQLSLLVGASNGAVSSRQSSQPHQKHEMGRMLRVLSNPGVSGPRPNATLKMLVGALPPTVEIIDFRWRRALGFGYDVLHVHWPEFIIRDSSKLMALYKQALFLLLILRLATFGTPSIWTVHNNRPHEEGTHLERLLFRLWERTVTRRVYMYDCTIPPNDRRALCIPHGDYEPVCGVLASSDNWEAAISGRVLLFGVLRPYKGIEGLIDAFSQVGDSSLKLILSGEPISPEYGAELTLRTREVPGVSLSTDRLSDEDLAIAIQTAECIVLPYTHMYNSGAALLALTLKRPIVVPDSPTMRELRAEVGGGWVTIYEGSLNADSLSKAVEASRQCSQQLWPDMSRRGWTSIGEQYGRLFDELTNKRASLPESGTLLEDSSPPKPKR
ncbi:glycosyltransferase [Cryobacterium sp. W22_MBD10_FK3]|uniref:glycosyltransferase n=1 Tax=Cryobacterium sp. W22_MBD10_FK3 TaxID=3240273 RepID=UPI003F927C42